MAQKKAWSFKEQRQLTELVRASKSPDEVANAVKRKPEAVKRMAMRPGVSFKPKTKK